LKILLCGVNGYIRSLFYQIYFKKYNTLPIDYFLVNRKRLNFVRVKDYRDLKEDFVNIFDMCI
jgi:hypothetical protein